jgi:hypothetical protein
VSRIDDQDVWFGPLPPIKRDRHLSPDTHRRRRGSAEPVLDQRYDQSMELRLRAHEDKAPVDQLGVRRVTGKGVEIFSREPARWRAHPRRQWFGGHASSL